MHPFRAALPVPRASWPDELLAAAPRVVVAAAFLVMLAGCAATGGGAADSSSTSGAHSEPPRSGPAESRSSADSPSRAAADGPEVTETRRATGKVEWVAVFESAPGARYNEQRVIYVDRNSVQPQQLDNLTYYLARTREVTRAGSKPKVQEIAVLCEGSPIAPATSLRAEGTEEGNGNYSLKRSPTPLTSVNQFSTQRVRADPNNPTPFIVRAVCLLGTGG